MGPFLLLVRHFFGRFFDNEIVSQQGDMRTNIVQALGLLAAPGMFVSFYMLPHRLRFDAPFARGWLLMSDIYFFVTYSMVVMGFVMVLQWDALFPDRRDYLVLTPLPLRGTSIFVAKSLALVAFLGLFLLDTNFFCTVLAPLIAGGDGTPADRVARITVAHAAALFSAGTFVALSFAAIQGVLINVLPGRWFRRVSTWVQMASMTLLVVVLFLFPLVSSSLRVLFAQNHPVMKYFPPFWFLGLYLDLLPGSPGGMIFHELAEIARRALPMAGALFVVTYLAGYRRHARRVMDSVETASQRPGRLRRTLDAAVNRWLVQHPLERATFHFISQTTLRSPRHRLFLAMYAGLAISLALSASVTIGGKPGSALLSLNPWGFVVVPLTLSFFVVSGLRAAFNLPVELRANWVFQTTESEDTGRHLRAARKWIFTMALAPLFALMLPVELAFRPWPLALVHVGFALAMSLLLLRGVFLYFRKIPFTCSYFPGKTSMAVVALLYLLGFTTYSWTMAGIEQDLIREPYKLAIFFALFVGALRFFDWIERRDWSWNHALVYEDEPDPIVRSLGIYY